MAKDDPPRIRRGWRARLGATARVARSAAQLAGQSLLKREVDSEARIGTALAHELDQMKGVAMKVGQILSYFDGVLPEQTHRALRSLQHGVTRMSFEEVTRVVESGLGQPLTALFDTFDERPIAAASIGQVHRASWRGRDVAVKVQYPGVGETMVADVSRMRALARLASVGTEVDGPSLVDELAARFRLECDYTVEAAHLKAFRAAFSGAEWLTIPAAHDERTCQTVLTTQWCDGQSFYAFAESAAQEEKDAVGLLLARFTLRCLYGAGAINADPHPGNYLFPGDGTVTFLDFGCVRRFAPDFFESQRRVARVVVEDQRRAFREVLLATGMVPKPRDFDFEGYWRLLCHQYAPYRAETFRFSTEYVRAGMELSRPGNPNLRRLAIPPQWIWAQRLLWGLHAVLARLNASGPFRAEFDAGCASRIVIPVAP
jgi:predicted unusual protein kinase regulating ubiquinone biosynthesis (AarF/ABC1/UbiB family)